MKYLVNVSPCLTIFSFCGLNPEPESFRDRGSNPIYAMNIFDTDVFDFCKAVDKIIHQRNLHRLDAKEGELSCFDKTEVQVGDCYLKYHGSGTLSIAAGYRELLYVYDVNHLKNLTIALLKAATKISKE